MSSLMLDDILLRVNKPARYIGGEYNASRKNFDQAYIKFALCFPDLYEVGMSNLGIRIIYGILNNIDDVCCERFFSVHLDMERTLRQEHLEIFSLESKRRLKEFDIIGFSLGYELGYTNVLNMLDLGSIPLRASLRDQSWPLVIGGGPCVLNPEPMHEFFDLFVLGEAEESILEIIDIYRKYKERFKAAKISKQDLLFMFSQIEGVYVPSFYEVVYDRQAKIEMFKPKIQGVGLKIKKRVVRDLNSAFFPLGWLIPHIQTVHDRISLEIMRGCPNNCRFCQARSQYFPLRIRNLKNILDLAYNTYRQTGYEEISLCGLSVSDYAQIEELSKAMVDLFKEKAVGISLPSIKPKTYAGNLSALIASIKKTGLTFAPEAATERLRKIIGKDFMEEDFFKSIEQAYLSGYQHVKLYFMLGLPYEELKDLDGIIDFAIRASKLKRDTDKSLIQVNLSINTFIPKPHTPFQWLKMEDLEGIKYRQDYLRKQIIRNSRLKLSFHHRYMSFLEGVISRADRRVSQVIFSAFKRGARFDAWGDYFNFDHWQQAFSELNIDPNFYLQAKSPDEFLPWDFVDIGINKELLRSEFEKAVAIEQGLL